MSKSHKRGHFFSRRRTPKARRPQHLSRRQQKQFSFETLEDRRVMSANSLFNNDELVSYSSATDQGREQILASELESYSKQGYSSGMKYILNSIPSDPLVEDQWYLINTGQEVGQPNFQDIFAVPGNDLNVASVWDDGYTGAGVVVAVVDSGVETAHPDLAVNIHPTLQLDALDLDGDANPEVLEFDIDDPIPWLTTFGNAHGTSVAGIIAAEADNGIGGTGIAYNAEIVPIRLIDINQPALEQSFIDTFRYRIDEIDITNNSWGPAVPRAVAGPTPDELSAIRDSIFFGRDGLGVIHVFAAGNGANQLNSTSYNGWVNSRYTIGVTSVDHDGEYNNVDGTVTDLSDTSASVLVAAYDGSGGTIGVGDDGDVGSGIVTTDTTGNTGYNIAPDPNTGQEFDIDFEEDIDYTSTFGHTSAAAPQVSGVIALMLEANPNLSWRDVQEILVRSSSQVSEFGTQADGLDKAQGDEYQNTWIINQVPLFHDPDPHDPLIDDFTQITNPTLDPNLNFFESSTAVQPFAGSNGEKSAHYAPTPQVLTNGAGYTVSQGRGTNYDQTGFAHGVVDAALAVSLAEQWHVKGQNLADELSFTTAFGVDRLFNLPAAELTVDLIPGGAAQQLIVPGSIGGQSGFVAYWNEYLDASSNFDGLGALQRGAPIELAVPSPNDMVVEHVEIKVEIAGIETEFLDHVRMVLVSPNGTHSELNHYFVDPGAFGAATNFHQTNAPAGGGNLQPNGLNGVASNIPDFIDPGSVDFNPDLNLDFTFSTNRNWGERSDSAIIYDPTTMEPFIDVTGLGGDVFNFTEATAGDLLTQGWQLHMENYGPTTLQLSDFEIIWHGSPIEENTERVQGLIGIDDNRDDLFNYSRVIQTIDNITMPNGTLDDPALLRLGEVQNIIDPDHESMGANVTVMAYSDQNGNGQIDEGTDILVDQFVTGADGNFYFDLVPGDYVIALDDSTLDGLTAVNDSLTAAGFVPDYQEQWALSEEYFQVWDYDSNLEVPIDTQTNAPVAFLDGFGNAVTTGVRNVNFLLDPGVPAAQQATFSGIVLADFNGDGVSNGDDIALPGINVFADTNRNGQFDAGENLTTTDANGQYTLIVDEITGDTVLNIGVMAPIDWVATDPEDGLATFFVSVGDVLTDVDFSLIPPSSSDGDGSNQAGILLGTVYDDINQDTLRQTDEQGLANVIVYIDGNNSGALEPGEIFTTTNENGAYAFADLAPGSYAIRIEIGSNPELVQTSPFTPVGQAISTARNVSISGGGTITDVEFGVYNSAVLDFGDLPAAYGLTTIANDGARHAKGVYYLGARIDSELDGIPSANADGDDTTLDDDEDGVILTPLTPGAQAADATSSFEVTASRYGGYLQAWIDFNGDGDFDDPGERILEDYLLPIGTSVVTYDLPDTIAASDVYARFRYGEFGLEITGAAVIGEVEDYMVELVTPVVAGVVTDFTNDGQVSGNDFMAWLRGYGTNSGATPEDGDSNGDGQVDGTDLENLQQDYGVSFVASATAAEETPPTEEIDTSLEVSTDGEDYLAWLRGYGTEEDATSEQGDADADGDIDGQDLTVILDNYGSSESTEEIVVAASISLSASELAPVVADTTTVLSEPVETALSEPVEIAEVAETPVEIDSTQFIGLSRALLGKRIEFVGARLNEEVSARLENEDALTKEQLVERKEAQRDEAFDSLFSGDRDESGSLQRESREWRPDAEEEFEFAFSDKMNWRFF